ncbi:fibronectin type III domain-containing protein [Longimicrobium sp.]|uniref:fibronectin type III domain-containing protein n=1 Tax=Longimicrobium sp. TaxID=2029185 RepID=UPI002CD113D6|nr:fibronectin type III domain-containing protein [Longimicrobium sp.]HSU17728.1 fibronectin type III domain-containing protein [Longimicrobium sp.]
MHRTLRAFALASALATLASCDSAAPLSPLDVPGGPPSFTAGAAFPAPAGFTVEGPGLSGGTVTLSWEDLPGDQLYLVQWRQGEAGSWKSLVSTGANRTTVTTDSLSRSQPNYYRVAGLTADQRQVGEFSVGLLKPGAYARDAFMTSDTTASLNAWLRPNGSPATTWFEVGTDPALAGATQTPAEVVQPHPYLGILVVTRDMAVTPGTRYYYRFAASNAAGTSYGPILHFSSAPPAAPAGVTATFSAAPLTYPYGWSTLNTAAHNVKVQWTHDGSDVWRFRVQRRGVGSANWVQVTEAGASERSYVDEAFPVTADREYDYRVLACNRIGQCGASAEVRVLVKGLAPPAGFTATRLADGRVGMAWQDLASEDGYFVQWRAGETGNWQTLVSTGKNVTSYTTASVTAGVTNYYRVAGLANSFRMGAASEGSVAAGAGRSMQVQTGIFTLPSSTLSAMTATVTPNGLAATAWIEWGTDPSLSGAAQTSARAVGAGTNAVTFTDSVAVSPGVTYYYRAAASNSVGTVRGAIKSFYAGPPATPSLSAAFDPAGYRIATSWTHSGVGTPTRFRLERRTTGQTAWTQLVDYPTTYSSSYQDASFPANAARSYDYRVLACNASNECAPSSIVTVQTQPLAAPAGLQVARTATGVTLSWQNITGEVDFLVQWRTDPSAPWKTLVSTGANVTSYSTASATPGATNYYRVAGEASGFRVGVFSETSIAIP